MIEEWSTVFGQKNKFIEMKVTAYYGSDFTIH